MKITVNMKSSIGTIDRLFYPFGGNESDIFLPPFDDTFALLNLSQPFPFYGNISSLLYVSGSDSMKQYYTVEYVSGTHGLGTSECS